MANTTNPSSYWLKEVSDWNVLTTGCHGSSDLAAVLLEVPFKAHQGQVSDGDVVTDHRKRAVATKQILNLSIFLREYSFSGQVGLLRIKQIWPS